VRRKVNFLPGFQFHLLAFKVRVKARPLCHCRLRHYITQHKDLIRLSIGEPITAYKLRPLDHHFIPADMVLKVRTRWLG